MMEEIDIRRYSIERKKIITKMVSALRSRDTPIKMPL